MVPGGVVAKSGRNDREKACGQQLKTVDPAQKALTCWGPVLWLDLTGQCPGSFHFHHN